MILSPHREAILMGKSYRILRHAVVGALEEFSLDMSQWTFLGVVSEAPGVPLEEIASQIGLSLPRAQEVARVLLGRGLVEPILEANEAFVLTKEGDGTVSVLQSYVHAALGRSVDGVTREESDVFFKVFETIVANAEGE